VLLLDRRELRRARLPPLRRIASFSAHLLSARGISNLSILSRDRADSQSREYRSPGVRDTRHETLTRSRADCAYRFCGSSEISVLRRCCITVSGRSSPRRAKESPERTANIQQRVPLRSTRVNSRRASLFSPLLFLPLSLSLSLSLCLFLCLFLCPPQITCEASGRGKGGKASRKVSAAERQRR